MTRTGGLLAEALAFVRLLASYGCAGDIGCVPGDRCGPCSAAAWLDLHKLGRAK